MASPLKIAELTAFYEILKLNNILFFPGNDGAKKRGAPDVVIPGNPNIAIYMGRQNPNDANRPSIRCLQWQEYLQKTGWRVCLPYGAADAVRDLKAVKKLSNNVAPPDVRLPKYRLPRGKINA